MNRNIEKEEAIAETITTLIRQIADYYEIDETSDLLHSDKRIAKMLFEELTKGYSEEATSFLKTFPSSSDLPVVIENIPVKSLCEHHFLPMYGTAKIIVKYKKGAPVLGMSKYYRIVDHFSRRFQLQERLTGEVASFLFEHLGIEGVVVMTKCDHYCMKMRGVNSELGNATCIVAKGCYEGQEERFLLDPMQTADMCKQ